MRPMRRLFRLCRNIAARVLHDTCPPAPSCSIPVRLVDDLIREATDQAASGMIASDDRRVDPTGPFLHALG